MTDLDQLRALLEVGCTEILLDNMDDETMAEAVRITAASPTPARASGLTRSAKVGAAETSSSSVGLGASLRKAPCLPWCTPKALCGRHYCVPQ